MSVLHNVARGAQEATSKWQSCLGRLPSPLETTKMAFRRLWHAIEVPHTHSSATQSRRRPTARASAIRGFRREKSSCSAPVLLSATVHPPPTREASTAIANPFSACRAHTWSAGGLCTGSCTTLENQRLTPSINTGYLINN